MSSINFFNELVVSFQNVKYKFKNINKKSVDLAQIPGFKTKLT